jgi:hypothetical protein
MGGGNEMDPLTLIPIESQEVPRLDPPRLDLKDENDWLKQDEGPKIEEELTLNLPTLEEPWTLNLPSATRSYRVPVPERELSGRPYSELSMHRSPHRGPNSSHMKMLKRIHLGDDSRCPSCQVLFDFEGKCCNPTCECYGSIVNEEKQKEFLEDVRRVTEDAEERWNNHLNSLEGR